MAHLRQAIGYQDASFSGLVGFYLLWSLLGWGAVMSLSLAFGHQLPTALSVHVASFDWLPGYRALAGIVTGPDCGGGLGRVQLAYSAGLAFILLCWLGYSLLIMPRYLRALRRLAPKVVAAQRGDVILDLGWKRGGYHFMPSSMAALLLVVTLVAFVDSLLYPHLVAWGCARSWIALSGAGFRWLGYHWLLLQILWCGLAVLAPHALLLLDQAWVMTHGGKRVAPIRRQPPPAELPAPSRQARNVGRMPAKTQQRPGRHTVEREPGFLARLSRAFQSKTALMSTTGMAVPTRRKAPASTGSQQAGATLTPSHRQRDPKPASLEQLFADAAARWGGEAIQAMRANDDYPTDHMALSRSYFERLAKAARKLQGRKRQVARAQGGVDAALLREEHELVRKALKIARQQLDSLAPAAPERAAAQSVAEDLQQRLDSLRRHLGQGM